MREIKFRGKRTDALAKDEWVYGLPVYNRDCTGIDKIEVPRKAGSICRLVDPETVGQYTGLKDREGKEIYEGDIIRWHDIVTADYAITFEQGVFCLNGSPNENLYHHREEINLRWEVIGNRWDQEGRVEA